jgi:hypothetical protein
MWLKSHPRVQRRAPLQRLLGRCAQRTKPSLCLNEKTKPHTLSHTTELAGGTERRLTVRLRGGTHARLEPNRRITDPSNDCRSHARSLWSDWSPHCPEAHKLSRRELLMNDLHDLLRELLGAR